MRAFNDATRRNITDRCAAFTRTTPVGIAPDLKRASVAIALAGTGDEANDTAFLLTRRTAGLRAHRAQWALPGGRCDAGETAIEAALRELHEELGLALGPDAVLGLLDDYPTGSGYLITPVVICAAANQRGVAISNSPTRLSARIFCSDSSSVMRPSDTSR